MNENYMTMLRALQASNREKGYSLDPKPAPVPAPVLVPPPVTAAAAPPASGGLDDGAKTRLRQVDLLGTYQRWFAPQSVRPGGGDEVNCSCFNTHFHSGGDKNPQLGFNTAKNTYYCHACGVKGDIVDLAAIRWGFCDSNWECPDDLVHEAVKYAGEELLGMAFRKTPAGFQLIPEFQPAPLDTAPRLTMGSLAPTHQKLVLGKLHVNSVASMTPSMENLHIEPYSGERKEETNPECEDLDTSNVDFKLDWRAFVPENTPLSNYLHIACTDESPEEFHFWNFMSLIGLAMGKKVFLPDVKPVYGNMLLCLVGRTGQGKSRSEGYISELIRSTVPFDESDHLTDGVRIIKNPGSGEYLSHGFIHKVLDPSVTQVRGKPPRELINPSVKALIRWPEMATMISKNSNTGSTIQTTVIDLYDNSDSIGGGSLKNGSYEARNPFGSISTTTQLSQIRRLVTGDDASSGFLNRWWFVIGKSKPFEPWGSYVDVSPIKHDVEMITKWAENKYRTTNGMHKITPAARDVASEFLVNRCKPLEDNEDDEMMRRAVLSFKKLIFLFSANMMEDEVSVSAVEQAKIAFEYIVQCMQHIGAKVGESDYEIALDATIEAIAKTGLEGITPRDLKRILKRKTKQPTEKIEQYLNGMEQSGRIELQCIPQPGGKPGAPKKRFVLCDE